MHKNKDKKVDISENKWYNTPYAVNTVCLKVTCCISGRWNVHDRAIVCPEEKAH